MIKKIINSYEVQEVSERLDISIAKNFSDFSRTYIQKLIKKGHIFIDKKKADKSSCMVHKGQKIKINIPKKVKTKMKPLNIPLTIIFQDKNIAVIDKPAGLVVHPSKNNENNTLVNGLLFHLKGKLSGISGELRPGIVHRLDKDTSGVLIVAKNDKAHRDLSEKFKNREVKKTYVALVFGILKPKSGKIIAPIMRSSQNRKKMAISMHKKARDAVTSYTVEKYFKNSTLIKAFPETGRTHQIRVHLSSIRHPIAGDQLYGNRKFNVEMEKIGLKRHFLHATEISFCNIGQSDKTTLKSQLPIELKETLKALETI